jgi:hypothetical protein
VREEQEKKQEEKRKKNLEREAKEAEKTMRANKIAAALEIKAQLLEKQKKQEQKDEWHANIQQREDKKLAAFMAGREHLKSTFGSFPPNRAFATPLKMSDIKASKNGPGPQLKLASFLFADVTKMPTDGAETWDALTLEVRSAKMPLQKGAKAKKLFPNVAIRCRVDQMASLCAAFTGLGMVADAPFVVGSTMASINLNTLDGGNFMKESEKHLHGYHKTDPHLQGLVGGYILTFCHGAEQLQGLRLCKRL